MLWHSRPTAKHWRPALRTAHWSCGISPPARKWWCSKDTAVVSNLWPSHPTDQSSPRRAPTKPCGCGGLPHARKPTQIRSNREFAVRQSEDRAGASAAARLFRSARVLRAGSAASLPRVAPGRPREAGKPRHRQAGCLRYGNFPLCPSQAIRDNFCGS